jgi:hypothetical protein
MMMRRRSTSADVQVYEIRLGVLANPSAMERKSDVAQARRLNSRHSLSEVASLPQLWNHQECLLRES